MNPAQLHTYKSIIIKIMIISPLFTGILRNLAINLKNQNQVTKETFELSRDNVYRKKQVLCLLG